MINGELKNTIMVQHGRFYFKQTANENLHGEFSNEHSNITLTESGDIIGEVSNKKFTGKYQTTWFDTETQKPVRTMLEISSNESNKMFKLTWSEENNTTFQGEGFIVDDILIGTYWSATSKSNK